MRALEDSAWRDARTQSEWLGWEDAAEPDPEHAPKSGGMFFLRAVETAQDMDQTGARQVTRLSAMLPGSTMVQTAGKDRATGPVVFRNRVTP